MAEESIAVSFAGGELRFPAKKPRRGEEVVLAVPLGRLVAAVMHVGEDKRETMAQDADALLKTLSPFPDETLVASCETLRETQQGAIVLAAALPEGASEDIAEALDAAKLNVRRVDAAALGVLRSAWGDISGGAAQQGRSLVLVVEEDDLALFVMDGDCPVAVRALPRDGADARRDITLALLKAEDFAGSAATRECVVVGDAPQAALDALASFAPVRRVDCPEDSAARGVAERSGAQETAYIDAMPPSWREVLDETRFKRSLRKFLAISLSILGAAVAAMAGGPFIYGHMTANIEAARRRHKSAYNKVNEKRRQVESVRSVSNHDLGALETLRVVSSVMPEGIVLSKWNFKRGDRLSFSGTAEDGDQQKVYVFKDGLAGVMLSQISASEDDSETPFFTEVTLPRGVVQRGSKTMFDVDCSFKPPEDADR